MAHLSPDVLMARLLAAREAGNANQASPEQLRLLRELVRDCPAFTPALLELARLLQLTDEPGVDAEAGFTETQRLLEQATQVSRRSAPTLVELGYFLDTIRGHTDEATALWEEGASKAQRTLEDAWTGLLGAWAEQRTKESLGKALRLAEVAEKAFPDSPRLMDAVHRVRTLARAEGLLRPEES